MYCPKCGKPEQIPNAYCRNCGEFLSDFTKFTPFSFSGKNSPQNIQTINILSLITAILSLFAVIWMYFTEFNIPIVLYFGAVILICNTGWHLSNFLVGVKLKNRMRKARKKLSETTGNLNSVQTQELLSEANFEVFVPVSITEETTKNLNKI